MGLFISFICLWRWWGLRYGLTRKISNWIRWSLTLARPQTDERRRWLVAANEVAEPSEQVSIASLEQASEYRGKPFFFVRECAVVFIWTAIPYCSEWRYGPATPKLIALDSRHICLNLYVACGAIDVGTCAMSAFNWQKMDAVLELDGDKEFSFYMVPVGKTWIGVHQRKPPNKHE